MVRVGIDILEIERIRKIIRRNNFFLEMCFSNKEIDQLSDKTSFYSSVASRFCAKEAFFKCIGKKIEKIKYLKYIQILSKESGEPFIVLSSDIKQNYEGWNFSLSISHCNKFACACVISEFAPKKE